MTPSLSTDGFDAAVRGVCPVLEVPFDDHGALDVEGFDNVVDRVLGCGVTCVMWPGFASEFYKLSDDERTVLRGRLLARVSGQPGTWAIISVARHATRLAVADAVAAADEGAHALNVLPPSFLSPSRDSVLEHLQAILLAVAPVPVIVQYAPGLAPTPVGSADLTCLAAQHPNLRMVKVDIPDAGTVVTELRHGRPSLPTMVGYGGITMIEAARGGAVGVQPGCSFVEVYQRIWRLLEDGHAEEAGDLHQRLLKYVTSWIQEIELIIQVEKSISKKRGWIASEHCRAPRRELDAADRASISRFLSEFAELLPA